MSDQRDQTLERLLRQSAAASTARLPESCLDGETLAAWTSHALSTEEATRVEQHLSDCARCQEMVAVLARTMPATAPPTPSLPFIPALKWLVPLATAVIVMAVWVSLPDSDRNAQQRSEVTSSVSANPSGEAPQTQAGPAAPLVSPAPASPVPTAPLTSIPSSDAAAKETRALMNRPEAKRETPAKRELEIAAPVTAAPSEASKPSRRGATADAPVPERVGGASPPAPAGVPSPPPLAESVILAERMAVTPRASIEIVTPSPSIRWRVTNGTTLQRSTTGGAEWQTVAFTTDAPILAGHAPSANVVWLVGGGGAIYLAFDGINFTRLSFADTVDLVAVTAANARQAVVRAADGRAWRTSDGGRTWVREQEDWR